MNPQVISSLQSHAIKEYPKECCGLVVVKGRRHVYVACENSHTKPEEHFRISKAQYELAESQGEVVAVCHSHPDASNEPSMGDLVEIEHVDMPFLIVSVYKDLMNGGELLVSGVNQVDPVGYLPPLEGRPFVHGILDCYSLIRDCYKTELSIDLPDFEREDGWWEKTEGPSLYLENFGKAGFVKVLDHGAGLDVASIRKYDVIMMEVASVNGPNHSAVYMGDGMILHHVYGKPSNRALYGGYWQQATRCVVRHKDLL